MRPLPPRAGSDADREALAACLAGASFTEATLCTRLGIGSLDDLERGQRGPLVLPVDQQDGAALLIRLLVLGEVVDGARLGAVIQPDAVAAMQASGLICPADDGPAFAPRVYATVRLVPQSPGSHSGRDLWIASDRATTIDGATLGPFSDVVFSGHNPLSRQFVRLVPKKATGSVLDVCSGTGVAALAVAAAASRVTAVDITDRSCAFARFNAWLNGYPALDVRRGDLFEPVRGERFDRILAHPPYVPTLSETAIYRDGGRSGDELVRRIVAGIPEFLDEGGTFHLLSIGMDTADAPFEMRARQWMGPAGREFDLVYALVDSKTPEAFARMLVSRVAGSTPEDHDRWMELFTSWRVTVVVYGALVGRRFAAASGEPQTRRVMAEPSTGPEGFEWMLDWFAWWRRPNRHARILASRPVLDPGLTAEIHSVVENRALVPRTCKLANAGRPFTVRMQTDSWVVGMIARLDGSRTAADVYAAARQAATIPPEMTDDDFAALLGLFAERGLVGGVMGD
jgi:SAM-dependent methyltransferase